MNKIFKLLALAMLLCVGFFTGCKEEGWKPLPLQVENKNNKVVLTVDVPEKTDAINIIRNGDTDYISLQMPNNSNGEIQFFLLAKWN